MKYDKDIESLYNNVIDALLINNTLLIKFPAHSFNYSTKRNSFSLKGNRYACKASRSIFYRLKMGLMLSQ